MEFQDRVFERYVIIIRIRHKKKLKAKDILEKMSILM